MLTPSIGCLLHAIHRDRLGQARRFEQRGRDVDDVVELRADLALALDPLGPVDDRAVARAAPVRRDLLGPLVGRVHRVRPAHRVVVVGFRPAELVDPRHQEFRRLERGGAVEVDHLVVGAVERALGRRAVVADDVVDQRVVEQVRASPACRAGGRRGGRRTPGIPRRPPSGGAAPASAPRACRPTPGSPCGAR